MHAKVRLFAKKSIGPIFSTRPFIHNYKNNVYAFQSPVERTMMLLSLTFLALPALLEGSLQEAMVEYVFKNSPKQWFTYLKKYLSLSLREIEDMKLNRTIMPVQINVSSWFSKYTVFL